MSYEKYCAVIDEICKLIGHSHPRQFYETANITVFDASFSLMHGGAVSPDHMIVFCDFGPLPDDLADIERFEIIKTLLAVNLDMAAKVECGSFSLNPNSGHILFSSALPLSIKTAANVMQILEHYAKQFKAWKASLYGENPGSSSAPDMSPVATGAAGQGRSRQATLLRKFSTGGQ